MRIGYACLTVGTLQMDFKSLRKVNLTSSNLKKVIAHNLQSLISIIEYNAVNEIKLFRITSDLIPFGASALNKFDWGEYFIDEFKAIGRKIKKHDMRVSMHPGQYTVLNSIHDDVVQNAILDLEYHEKVLSLMDLDDTHKIVLHIGGVYGNKNESILRFMSNYKKLNERVKKRLVIENDDKSFNVMDVLLISEKLKIPVVFDHLHNKINSSSLNDDEFKIIKRCVETWSLEDGAPKVHYSNQALAKKAGSHSLRIDLIKFADFVMRLESNVDIMLEVKDKNISAIKCNNIFIREKRKKILLFEWQLYKYKILECNRHNYLKLEELLKEDNPNFLEFYLLIDESLEKENNQFEALDYIFELIKKFLKKSEILSLHEKIKLVKKKKYELSRLKKNLFQKVLKYEIDELMNSYYFYI